MPALPLPQNYLRVIKKAFRENLLSQLLVKATVVATHVHSGQLEKWQVQSDTRQRPVPFFEYVLLRVSLCLFFCRKTPLGGNARGTEKNRKRAEWGDSETSLYVVERSHRCFSNSAKAYMF